MAYDKYLYMTLYPNNALIGSQLEPEHFARHYTSGSSRHFSGKVIFAQIDPSYRNDYFPIDEMFEGLVPHEDGRPKATKFCKSYRVLEHVDFTAIQKLYLVTQEGHCLGLDPQEHTAEHVTEKIRLYAEISPMRMMALSEFDFPTFGNYITDPAISKSAPKQFYTQLEIDLVDFVDQFERNPFTPSPIHNIHPSTLRDGFWEIQKSASKHSKGIALDSNLEAFSFKLIRHGFMFASQQGTRFFPMPDLAEIEKTNFKFWKTM